MKIKEFIKENKKGLLYSSIAVVLGYPLVYLFEFRKVIPLENILYSIPIAFVGVFTFMIILGFIMNMGDKE